MPQVFSADVFRAARCTVTQASHVEQARRLCADLDPDLVIMPLTMQGQSLLPYQKKCMEENPHRSIIIIAENDQINEAAEAMRNGAADCLFRPFSEARFERTLLSTLGLIPPRMAHAPLPDRTGAQSPPDTAIPPSARAKTDPMAQPAHAGVSVPELMGTSAPMQHLITRMHAIARSPASVIIRGEVGSGKSILARALHDAGRPNGPFVIIGPEVWTGQPGDSSLDIVAEVRRAEGGTFLIDRLDELAMSAQTRLLPIVQRHAAALAKSPVRFVATLGGDPYAAMAAGRLREDLFYCLNVLELALPPLRQRTGDIALLTDSWLPLFAAEEGRTMPRLLPDALAALDGYAWPGNLRELQSVIREVVLTFDGTDVSAPDLPARITGRAPAAGPAPPQAFLAADALVGRTLSEVERLVIEATIEAEGGSIPRAAKVLGVSPSTIYRKRDTWN
nr:sigma 54-interacting transcriptional regulator [Maritimibacter sp. DP1N21-5]